MYFFLGCTTTGIGYDYNMHIQIADIISLNHTHQICIAVRFSVGTLYVVMLC